MRHVLAIARRELGSYFSSPIAYVVMAVYTFVSGLFFSNMLVFYVRQAALIDRQIQQAGRADSQIDVPTVVLSQFFGNEAFLLWLVLPLLTMGLVTDERRRGTLELLVTSPVRSAELAGGKFLGAFTLLLLVLLPTVPMFAFLAQGGDWEPGVVLTGLLGLLLAGAAEIALGLFVSSLCENLIVSAFATYGIFILLWFVDTSANAAQSIWADLVSFFSFYTHAQNSTRGVVALGDVLYFLSYVLLGLFFTQRSIEAIRYRRS